MLDSRSNLARRFDQQRSKSIDVDEQLEKLEDDIRKLKIEFDIYFNGGSKAAPHRKRASLEARINRLNGNRDISFAQRFKLNNIHSKYTSYRQLWRRKLKIKGEDLI